MPGEISRSNPGPRGNTPYVPSWIEVDNLRIDIQKLELENCALKTKLQQLTAMIAEREKMK